jgi:hypothetical protein
MSQEYAQFAAEAIFAVSVIFVLFLIYRTTAKHARLTAYCDEKNLVRSMGESLEATRIVANFRIFLIELRGRVLCGEISIEKARKLVFAEKAATFDKIHKLIL